MLTKPQCYVDALGPSQQWQDRLSSMFPTIQFTVCPKADSIYKIVGAASIIAKVTRDRYIEQWTDPEGPMPGDDHVPRGSGYPSGELEGGCLGTVVCMALACELMLTPIVDPKTQAFLRQHIDPVFGYRGITRFSWATVKVLLEKEAASTTWIDDVSQQSVAAYFGSAGGGKVAAAERERVLGLSGVGEL